MEHRTAAADVEQRVSTEILESEREREGTMIRLSVGQRTNICVCIYPIMRSELFQLEVYMFRNMQERRVRIYTS